MPKQVKYVQQMMEKLEDRRKKEQGEQGDDAKFYVSVSKNDVAISLHRDPSREVEIISVFRFGTAILVIRRELSTLYKTGANLAVTLHPGAYSGSDRDCIHNVLNALYVYQIDNVTARGGNIQLHYTARDEKGTQLLTLQCTDGEEATLIL